jgi:hypothetical protein
MGLIRGIARTAVVAGTATAVSNRVSRRQANRWAVQDQQDAQQEAYEVPAEAPRDRDMSSKLDQLTRLGDLKAQGMLTESEFAQQKARILGP